MFTYCTEVLQLSEHEAYLRIAVARASREHPILLEMLADGRLHLSGIARLAPLLTESNRDEVLGRAAGKSKRQIEELVAELSPRPDVPASLRKLPSRQGKTQPTPKTELSGTSCCGISHPSKARGGGASVSCSFQDSVYGKRGAARQDGTTPGAHALLRP